MSKLATDPDRAIFLNFDRAEYPEGLAPCQVLAHSFYSSGISYCIEAAPGLFLPIPKKSIRAAMEHGAYLWASEAEPRYIDTGSGVHITLRAASSAGSYKPKFSTWRHVAEAYASLMVFSSFERRNARNYRFDPATARGNNIPAQANPTNLDAFEASENAWDQAQARARGDS